MSLWTSAEAESATLGKASRAFEVNGLSIDTRTIRPGEAFFAIKGDSHDGHAFTAAALAAGGALAVVSPGRIDLPADAPLLEVPDVLEGLIALARDGMEGVVQDPATLDEQQRHIERELKQTVEGYIDAKSSLATLDGYIRHITDVFSDPAQQVEDSELRVTYHHNMFTKISTGPRVRWGIAHVANNLFRDVSTFGVVSESDAYVFVQNNMFDKDVATPIATTYQDDLSGTMAEMGNIFPSNFPIDIMRPTITPVVVPGSPACSLTRERSVTWSAMAFA